MSAECDNSAQTTTTYEDTISRCGVCQENITSGEKRRILSCCKGRIHRYCHIATFINGVKHDRNLNCIYCRQRRARQQIWKLDPKSLNKIMQQYVENEVNRKLTAKNALLKDANKQLDAKQAKITQIEQELTEKNAQLSEAHEELDVKQAKITKLEQDKREVCDMLLVLPSMNVHSAKLKVADMIYDILREGIVDEEDSEER